MAEPKGKFRIQNVAELTGVPASTLRTWEQRYGFPSPDRTASSYRIYSQDDIDQIARIRQLCEQGLSAAEAVESIVNGGGAPAPAAAPSTPVPQGVGPASTAIVEAAAAFDPAALERSARAALLVASQRQAFAEAISPAWKEVRRRWLAGELGRHHERLAAEVLGHLARDILRHHQPHDGAWAVIGCFGDEEDAAPAFDAGLSLQARGHRVQFLGTRTRPSVLRHAVADLDARVAGLALSDAITGQRARDLVDDYAAAVGRRRWFVVGEGAAAVGELVGSAGGTAVAVPADLDAMTL